MAVVSMKQFIEAGVHYGHQTRRWNPKMRPYIFGTKHGVHIIDLQKSLRMLKEAYEFVRDLCARGEPVLFVGTKLQARVIIREEALRSNSFYINERWLGGLLTNFNTVKQSIGYLKKLEDQRGEEGLYEGIIKKEALKLEKKRVKLEKALGGIKEMRKLPGAVFVIDCKKERIAIKEAQKLAVPIVAVVDSNCDPDNIDYIIPGNDDAIGAIQLFTATIANAVMEGRALHEAEARTGSTERPRTARARGGRAAREQEAALGAEPAAGAPEAAAAAEPAAPDVLQPTAAPEPAAPDVLQPTAATEPAAPDVSQPTTVPEPAAANVPPAADPPIAVPPADSGAEIGEATPAEAATASQEVDAAPSADAAADSQDKATDAFADTSAEASAENIKE